jgi:tetratricopeptide (TPR) repeat protein
MRQIKEVETEFEPVLKKSLINKVVFFIILGLWILGWIEFRFYNFYLGSALIVFAFVFFIVGIFFKKNQIHMDNLSFAFFFMIGSFLFFSYTKAPVFLWGKDPSIWIAIQNGEVISPLWSPLTYLVGDAILFLSGKHSTLALTLLSPILASLCIGMLSYDLFKKKSKNILEYSFVAILIGLMGISKIFWEHATILSGSVELLGFLLFLIQKKVLSLSEENEPFSIALIGFLFSVNWIWGCLGIIQHIFTSNRKAHVSFKNIFSFLWGCSGYLWIFFRAEKVFPSWGGEHPFSKFILYSFKNFQNLKIVFGKSLLIAPGVIWLIIFGTLLVISFKFRLMSKKDRIFLWVSFLGLMISAGTQIKSVDSVFFVLYSVGMTVLGQMLDFSLNFKKKIYFLLSFEVVVGGLIFFIPYQTCFQQNMYFPMEYALNLKGPRDQNDILIVNKAFTQNSLFELKRLRLVSKCPMILIRKYLSHRWYLKQVIVKYPSILFSKTSSDTWHVLENIILDNINQHSIFITRSNPDSKFKHWLNINKLVLVPHLLVNQISYSSQNYGLKHFRFNSIKSVSSLLRQFAFGNNVEWSSKNSFNKCIEKYVAGLYQMGIYFYSLKAYSKSIVDFEYALSLNPKFYPAKHYLNLMYSKYKIIVAAKLKYEKTLTKDPLILSKLQTQEKEAQSAKNIFKVIGILKKIISVNAQLSEVQSALSKIYMLEGKKMLARHLSHLSRKMNSERIHLQVELGNIYKKFGNKIQAEKIYRSILVEDPVDKKIQKKLWQLVNQ